MKIFLKHIRDKFLINLQESIDYSKKKLRKVDKTSDEAIALTHILSLNPKTYIPLTSWSLFPTVLNRILNDVVINERKNILEFGAGTSTLFLALLIKRNKLDAKVNCIESDEKWIYILKKMLEENDCMDYVSFLYSPITELHDLNPFSKSSQWYDVPTLKNLLLNSGKFDMVIVDGPQGNLCTNSRYPALPFIQDYLAENFSLYLDDLQREEERQISEEWSKILGVARIRYSNAAVWTINSTYVTKPFYYSI